MPPPIHHTRPLIDGRGSLGPPCKLKVLGRWGLASTLYDFG